MSLKKAIASIKRNNAFIITSHLNLEGDALGSQIAFYILLKKLGKVAFMVNEDEVPKSYDFLPYSNKIMLFNKGLLKKLAVDCFAILDCSDLSRCGNVSVLSGDKPTLNIDHHTSNSFFGSVNWVEPRVSSTAQMVYELYKALNVRFDKESALALYVGILTDTGSFRYSNTSGYTHRIVSELMNYKINVTDIYKKIYENMSFKDLKKLLEILPTIKMAEKGKIAWFLIKGNPLKDKNSIFDISENVLSFARAIKGVEVVVLFKENPNKNNEIRMNLRSQGKVDVNRVAGFFGGGGHKTASGATVCGDPSKIRKKVIAKLKDSLQ